MRSVITGVILVALAFVMMLVGLSMVAGIVIGAALLSPAKGHDHYGTWFGADGGACCSDLGRECRPVRSYYDDDQRAFRILRDGRWQKVPAGAVRPYRSFDGSSHACIGTDGTIYCFVNGEPKS